MIEVRLVDDLEALAPHKDAWNALAACSDTSTVYQTYEWNACWWRAFGGDARALVLVAERDGKLVGIAPLMLSQRRVLGRKRRVVAFMGYDIYAPCAFIVDPGVPDVLPALLQWLHEQRALWDLLLLEPMPHETTLASVAAFFRHLGYSTQRQALDQAPSRVMGDEAADRKIYAKQDMRSRYNALARQGALQWKVCTEVGEILDHYALFAQWHIRRWADSDTPSQFLQPAYWAFHRELVRSMAPPGWLRLSVLVLDQQPIGFWFSFLYGGRLVLFTTTYDVDWASYSPGLVTLKCQLEDAVRLKVSEIDLGRGQEAYKSRFANRYGMHYAIWVHKGAASSAVDRCLLAALAKLERMPTLRRAILRLTRRLRGR